MLADKITKSLDWDKLRSFYFVAKIGSISHAADHLNITQPSLSRNIQHLENRLECQLFNRVPKGMVLTLKGQILFEWVNQLFESAEMMKEKLHNEIHEIQGSLRIATTNSLASAWLIYEIGEFLTTYPTLTVSIIGNDQELDLTIREADILIRPFIEKRPDLIQTLLMTWHPRLYAHPTYLEKFGLPKTVECLKNHRLLAFGDNISFPYESVDWHLNLGMARGERHHPWLRMNSSHGLLQAAEQGLGIITFSQESPLLKNSGVVPILPQIKGPKIDIYYIYSKGYEDLKKNQFLLAYLKKRIEKTHQNY